MTAVTAWNKFVNFERRSQVFSEIKRKSFVRIPWLYTLYCVTLGVFSRKKHKYMEYITVTFLWKMFLVPGSYRTVRQSLDALLRIYVMPIRDFSFNLNWNISNTTYPLSMPRITAVDEWDYFSKALKTSQSLLFRNLVLSGSYDVWEGTHATSLLERKQSTLYSFLTSQRCVRQSA